MEVHVTEGANAATEPLLLPNLPSYKQGAENKILLPRGREGDEYGGIHVTPLPFSPVQFQYNCYSKKETNRSSHSDTKKLDNFITCNNIV